MTNMEIITQIEQMCKDSDNGWFLTHKFPKIALHDLKRKNDDDYEDMRYSELSKIVKGYKLCGIYDRGINDEYVRGECILSDKINGEIPGFMLIKCYGSDFEEDVYTHEIYFAFVKEKYRKNGILKSMIDQLPLEWNIWLEACSKEIINIEDVWKKCGFKFYKNIDNGRYVTNMVLYHRINI